MRAQRKAKMAADEHIKDFIKKENITIDEEDILNRITEGGDDKRLVLKPIVYTTKLDDMRAIQQDQTELRTEDLTEMIMIESKPKLTPNSIKNVYQSGSKSVDRYLKLISVIHQHNFKARNLKHRNLKLRNQRKPIHTILEDIKKSTSKKVINNDTGNTSTLAPSQIPVDIHVKIEAIDNETVEPQIAEKILFTSSSKGLLETSKTIEPQHKNAQIIPSSAKKAKTKEPVRRKEPVSSDDDDIALVNLKRKPVTPVPHLPQEKYTLVVLMKKNEIAYFYRIGATKLVTDYYITKNSDEYNLAAMYPKEEKIIEQYCCWFKREEVITKICSRKNYPFTIQKFLRQPHPCRPGNCHCCCCINKASDQNKEPDKQSCIVANKSLPVADDWIRGLLNRNKTPYVGLISKAMNYFPMVQLKEKALVKEPEKYLEFVLLCIKYVGVANNTFRTITELYEIGKNGNVVRSFLLDHPDKDKHIRRTYSLLGINTMDRIYCCWYTRETLMLTLRMAKMSPTALKLIQMSHVCERNNCICCCKPLTKPMKAYGILPTNLKHTTAYEKDAHPLVIRFNVTSKNPIQSLAEKDPKSKKPSNSTISIPEIAMSNCGGIENTQDLSASILKKFKNIKLAVTSEGRLEAILNAPAKNLSTTELKVLSEILSFSTTQIAELGISPEEFCKRINSQSGQSDNDDSAETPQINAPKEAPSSALLPKLQFERPIKKIAQTESETESTKINYAKTKSKVALNMYSSMTNLMEMKNKNYIDSFKSFFKNNMFSTSILPEIPKPKQQTKKPKSSTETSKEQAPFIKIDKTFTLATPSIEAEASGKAIAGPSRAQSEATSRMESSKNVNAGASSWTPATIARNDIMETNNNTKSVAPPKRKATDKPFAATHVDKMIRVKSPSELMTINTVDLPETPVQSNPLQVWPGPIVIKREPQYNTIVNPAQPIAYQINPNLQTQPYLIPIVNNTAPLNSFYQVNSNGQAPATSANSIIVKKEKMRYLTLTPLAAPHSNENDNDTVFAQILKTSQVQPVTSGENCLPPLVKIKTSNIIPKPGSATVAVTQSGARSSTTNNITTLPVTIKKEFD